MSRPADGVEEHESRMSQSARRFASRRRKYGDLAFAETGEEEQFDDRPSARSTCRAGQASRWRGSRRVDSARVASRVRTCSSRHLACRVAAGESTAPAAWSSTLPEEVARLSHWGTPSDRELRNASGELGGDNGRPVVGAEGWRAMRSARRSDGLSGRARPVRWRAGSGRRAPVVIRKRARRNPRKLREPGCPRWRAPGNDSFTVLSGSVLVSASDVGRRCGRRLVSHPPSLACAPGLQAFHSRSYSRVACHWHRCDNHHFPRGHVRGASHGHRRCATDTRRFIGCRHGEIPAYTEPSMRALATVGSVTASDVSAGDATFTTTTGTGGELVR